MAEVALLDVDGTLVDSNYHHALAWYRAFRQHGVTLPLWRVHREIGKGGDQLVSSLAGERFEDDHGEDVRGAEKVLYRELIHEVAALEGARELIEDLKRDGAEVILASSAKQDEVEHYVDLLDARELADAWTTSADVDATKPAPDLVQSALARASGDGAAMLGDSVWDCIAARRAEVKTVAVLTGGFSKAELEEAGALAVYSSIVELREHLAETPLTG
ncbi:MAG: HAD family hydrolase [Actinobacteria bacterium]|nr:MAG: HAD family hydrolase [Actinomycetota bacterium]